MTKQVDIIAHTTCGLEFEIVDAETQESLTGRAYWCSDEDMEEDDEIESRGWSYARKVAAKNGWEVREVVWS
jgi:hypothetical protein